MIVGIDYDSPEREQAQVPRLKFAESDARAVHDLLISNYGFPKENTTLLLGRNATRDAVVERLSELCTSDVQEDDCVLFYFSGHGFGRQADVNEPTEGELLPADVLMKDGNPSPAKVVEMKWIVGQLSKWCKARHKLLILDCCHSGAVFATTGRGAAVFDVSRLDESAFRAPGFQAMTASRELQKASDGEEGHSPFTNALLKALERLPMLQKEGDPITTTELFSGMQWFLDTSLQAGQSPRCSWLDGGQGEFHFFPEGEFPDPEVPDDQIRKVMLAMVPGSFGHWWFEETPWFMPGFRYEILEDDTDQRSLSLDLISPLRLEQAARKTRNRLANDPRPPIAMRVRHLDRLLNARGEEWQRAIRDILAELEQAASGAEDMQAVDVHYLAVLLHATGAARQEVVRRYDVALKLYQEEVERSPRYKPLLALCLADRAWYALNIEKDYEQASHLFTQARSIYGGITPRPFQIYALCNDADCLARLGRRGAARDRLNEADRVLKDLDPGGVYPLSAAYLSRRGWMKMNWCEFKSATEDFDSSTRILEAHAEEDDDAQILCFHNEHGVAMALRFSGNRDAAIEHYRALLQDGIYQKFVTMRESTGRATNFQQVKGRLVERWVNTLERLGDCSLFGCPSDPAEAADDYRRGLQACAYLPPERRGRWEQRLRCKYALAVAVPHPQSQDLELAEMQLKLAQGDSTAETTNSFQEKDIDICSRLTRLFIAQGGAAEDNAKGTRDGTQLRGEIDAFRGDLRQRIDENIVDTSLTRDDIEAILFASRALIEEFPNPAELPSIEGAGPPGRLVRREDLEYLASACRLGRRGGPESLPFVRPYYDCLIQSLVELDPKDTKHLIHVAWEAINGNVHFKPRTIKATLLLYCSEKGSYFFLDVPRGVSACYALPPGLDVDSLHAAATGQRAQFPLPESLRKELLALPMEVVLAWHDPVLGIGVPSERYVRRTAASGEEGGGLTSTSVTPPQPASAPSLYVFPFAVPENIAISGDQPIRPKDPVSTTAEPITTEVAIPRDR